MLLSICKINTPLKEDINMNIELTVNSYIFQSAKRLLEKELEKCSKLLMENEEKWNSYIDLKLHYANTTNVDFEHYDAKISFDSEAQNRWFNTFCVDMFEEFDYNLKEKGIDFEELKHHIGSTSKFYLGKLYNNNRDKLIYALVEASYDFATYGGDELIFTEDEKGIHLTISDNVTDERIEETVNDMLEMTETIYSDLKDKLDEIIYVYDYIEEFKDNQVENFKEYVRDTWLANI